MAELKAEMAGRPIVAQEREVLSNNLSCLQQARMFGGSILSEKGLVATECPHASKSMQNKMVP